MLRAMTAFRHHSRPIIRAGPGPSDDAALARLTREPAFVGAKGLDLHGNTDGAVFREPRSWRIGWFYPSVVAVSALLAVFWWRELRPPPPPPPAPVVAEPEPPPPEVVELLRTAQKQIDDDHLTTPPGDNALESYRAVLSKAPGNGEALAGIERIATIYVQWAKIAEAKGSATRARRYIEKALLAKPDDPALLAELRRLEAMT
jgi:hypothetical protein